jgi:23S rRNA (cytidine1920-2'-O)/16S rRNA (cytidine1409-2'-O)-methyltransferase
MAARPAPKQRLDRLLVERGLAPTREQAQALILAGAIRVAGAPAPKPGHAVPADAAIALVAAPAPYASRAGAKLAAALDAFAIPVAGRVALDVGSSTGGFTDCLLQRGARRVHAVDAGTNQMIWRLRTDPRVHLLENTNARYLRAADVGEAPDLLAVDVAFISATLLLPALAPLLAPRADAVILVKPQFECGRAAVGKGGIVRDPAARQAAVERVAAAVRAAGGAPVGAIPSPVLGARGNQEWLLAARFPA